MRKAIVLLLYAMATITTLYATETLSTVVVGEVYDSHTLAPLPDINLAVVGKSIGTTTNSEGMFLLRLEINKPTKIAVSGIGYHKYTFTVEPGIDAGIDIALEEKNTLLQEVMITPGTQPAEAIMARVRANRSQNESPALNSSHANAQTHVFLSNIRAKHLNRKLWQNLQDYMIVRPDSSYLLPIYSRQTHDQQHDVHSSFLTREEYETLLVGLETAPDFYHNTVSLYSTAFLSPLASDGNTYYRFYLVDSIADETGKHYIVDFRTRNPYYATFNGQMEIDSATAGLLSISAVVPPQVNANYLKNATIEQVYRQEPNNLTVREMQDSRVNILLDMAVKTDNSHIFPSVLVSQEITNRKPEPVIHINNTLHAPIYHKDSVINLIDTLNSTPLFRVARFLAYTISTGYVPTGSYIEIGNVSEILKINNPETIHLGIPLRTSEKLWKNICLEACAAYGFGDHAWKGFGKIHINLPTMRRHQLTAQYTDEYVYSDMPDFTLLKRENAAWFRYMGFTTAIMRNFYATTHNNYDPLVRKREFCLLANDDWNDFMETQTHIAIGRMGYGEPTHAYDAQSSFRYANLSATLRFSWDEKKVDMFFRRIHVYNNKPVLYINGEIGSFTMDQEPTITSSNYHLYGKIQFMLRQQVSLGVVGQLDYTVEGGVILGAVPYPLLNIFDANETFAFDKYRFSLMQNYRYAADKYVALHADWNGRGCLFNLIPGIRCLHLRELAVFKFGYGTMSSQHEQILPLPYSTPNVHRLDELSTPYIEMGVGIGNILRFGEVYSIWRLTHRNDPNAPRWGLRFRLYIDR